MAWQACSLSQRTTRWQDIRMNTWADGLWTRWDSLQRGLLRCSMRAGRRSCLLYGLYIYTIQTSSRHLTAQRPQRQSKKGTRKHIYKLNQGTHTPLWIEPTLSLGRLLPWFIGIFIMLIEMVVAIRYGGRCCATLSLVWPNNSRWYHAISAFDQRLGNQDEDGNLLEKRCHI